jgi:hypothetical protein
MRKQSTQVVTGRERFWMRIGIFALLLVIVYIVGKGYVERLTAYTPPPFEENAVVGEPDPPANMAYDAVVATGGYSFAMAANVYQQENHDLLLYLTNPKESGIWLMCEVKNKEYGTMYKSGVLRQGEYLERLTPESEFPNEPIEVEILIYGFEPENYQSCGTVYMSTILQPW